jgi:hypothetical protein
LILFAWGSLYGATGTRHVFYLDSGGHVHQLYSTASGWSNVDVTALTNAPVAESGSALTSVIDSATNYVHVYYLGTNRQIYELYGTGTAWHSDDPSSLANAPAAGSGSALTSIIGTGSVIHVFYLDAVGNIYELYWLGGTSWHSDSPSDLAGVGPICGYANPSLTSFVDFSNSHNYMHVFCLASGEVYEFYWTGGSAWTEDDPRTLAGGPSATPGSKITSFIDNSNNHSIMHVFYLGTNENVYELYYAGWPWHSDDPSTLAGAPVSVSDSALTSFLGSSSGMHVMFLGTNEHVYELHWLTKWSYFDATAASHGVSAASGSALTSFQDLAGGARLYFLGANSHVYELYWQTEPTASETDLTVASGGTIAASGSALTGVVGP